MESVDSESKVEALQVIYKTLIGLYLGRMKNIANHLNNITIRMIWNSLSMAIGIKTKKIEHSFYYDVHNH